MHKILFYNRFIICMYMFRALLRSSSGGQNCIIQHLASSHCVGGRPVHSPLSTCAPDVNNLSVCIGWCAYLVTMQCIVMYATVASFVGAGGYLIRCSVGHTKKTHRQLTI